MRNLWLTTFLCLLAAASLVGIHAAGTTQEYSSANSGWNGTSRLFESLEGRYHPVTDPAGLSVTNRSLLLVIEPRSGFSPDEITACRDFLEGGNTLLLAGRGAGSQEFLAGIGSTISISGGDLLSLDTAYPTPAAVIAFPAGNATVPGNATSVVLNTPHALSGGEPLLVSSVLSWVDGNGDGKLNAGETMGSSTVFAREQVGSGTLFVLADPGIFLNGMIDKNPHFVRALLAGEPDLLVEQSRSATAASGGGLALARIVNDATIIKIGLLTVALGIIALIYGRKGAPDD